MTHSEIPHSKNPQYAENSQIVFRANQLHGFHTTRTSRESYYQTDHH